VTWLYTTTMPPPPVSTSPTSLHFDLPVHALPLSLQPVHSDTRNLLAHHSAAIDQLDQIAKALKAFQNLRSRREEYTKQRKLLSQAVPDFLIDALPNELLVEIFRLVALARPPQTQRQKSVRRGTLASVCRRWRNIVQNEVCVIHPVHMQLDIVNLSPRRVECKRLN